MEKVYTPKLTSLKLDQRKSRISEILDHFGGFKLIPAIYLREVSLGVYQKTGNSIFYSHVEIDHFWKKKVRIL